MTSISDAKGEAQRLTQFLLSDVIRISADAIICLDADQKITLFNDGATGAGRTCFCASPMGVGRRC